jgi:hypothetical protein
MVEEDERLEGGSAPPQFSCTQQDRGQNFSGPLQHPSAAAVSGQISEPQVPAVAEKVQKLLPRQQSSLVQQFDLEGGSAPAQFSCTQQDRGQSFSGPLQDLSATAGSGQISEPKLPAAAEKVKKCCRSSSSRWFSSTPLALPRQSLMLFHCWVSHVSLILLRTLIRPRSSVTWTQGQNIYLHLLLRWRLLQSSLLQSSGPRRWELVHFWGEFILLKKWLPLEVLKMLLLVVFDQANISGLNLMQISLNWNVRSNKLLLATRLTTQVQKFHRILLLLHSLMKLFCLEQIK